MRHHSASQDELHFNGVDWQSGGYAQPPAEAAAAAEELRGSSGPARVATLRRLAAGRPKGASELRAGADPQLLDEAGWGLILPAGAEPALRDALSPLLEWRRREAGELFRVFAGEDGLRPGESPARFLARHGAGGDPAPPALLPYYLLLAGSPEEIPFDFQAELDLAHAIGRVAFERIDDYASYAESVVAAEKGRSLRARLAAFFAPGHAGDPWSGFAERLLVRPLAEALPRRCADLEIRLLLGERAGKEALLELIGGSARPALLFAAAHGLELPPAHPRAAAYQGALVAAGWPGPAGAGLIGQSPVAGDPVGREHFLAAGDVRDDVDLRGLVAFLDASGSAGDAGGPAGDFLAALPRRMLCHPGGGALAVVARLGRLRGYSFAWSGAGEITRAYGEALGRLVAGERIGAALQPFGELRRALAGRLADRLEEAAGGLPDVHDLAGLAAAHDDARRLLLLGDPAIRLSWRDQRAPEPAAPEQRRHLRRGRSAGPAAGRSAGPAAARSAGQVPAGAEPARLAADR